MEIKLENGTVFKIETLDNGISIQKTCGNSENIFIMARHGTKLDLNDNLFYVM